MDSLPLVAQLTDTELIARVDILAHGERRATAELIAALEELDRRRLFLPAGYTSLFLYCTQRLRMSEGAAYSRIEAARAARRFPVILAQLANGAITLSTIGLLARHLTQTNHSALLTEASGKSKREVEQIVARLHPVADVPASIRKLPIPKQPKPDLVLPPPLEPASHPPARHVPRAAVIAPLAPERFKVQITVSRETHDTLRMLQDLMRHTIPNGDAAEIISRALALLLETVTRRKTAAVKRPREGTRRDSEDAPRPSGSRHVPSEVRRAVWSRDHARCTFTGHDGRCGARSLLEFHHVTPFAAGGSCDAGNIELRCRAHNGYEAEVFFGPQA